MDDVLVDNMEQDLSVWDDTDVNNDAISDVIVQVPVTETRRYTYQTSHRGAKVFHQPASNAAPSAASQ